MPDDMNQRKWTKYDNAKLKTSDKLKYVIRKQRPRKILFLNSAPKQASRFDYVKDYVNKRHSK